MLYLDYNATTPLDPSVERALVEKLQTFGNPSSLHRWGQEARFLLEESRACIAAACGRRPEEVIFTASATEALNLAIQGWARSHPGRPIVASPVEHPAVLATLQVLQREGVPVRFLPVDTSGLVDLEALEHALTDEPALVVIQAASGETGVIQPWEAIARITRQHQALWLADAAQIPGKADTLAVGRLAHLVVLSSHKVYGPKGIAALIRPVDLTLQPLMYGGEQEGGLRPGTENPPLAWAFAVALRVAQEHLARDTARMEAFRKTLEDGLQKLGLDIVGMHAPRLPNTTLFLSPRMEGTRMVAALDVEGIGVSSTSACLTGRQLPSPALRAMGYPEVTARRAVRISAGRWTRPEDAHTVLQVLKRILER